MIYLILLISACIRIWLISLPTIVFWDSAIYIGMGKHIFSHGVIGAWEPFRPLLLPLILGVFWKAGFNPLIVGKILQIIWSLGVIWMVYRIGETIQRHVGLVAATLLAFSPAFITYSVHPLTDIASILCALVALSAFTKNKHLISGLCVAASFWFRFPQAIVIVALGFCIIVDATLRWKEKVKPILLLFCGFLIGSAPFYIYSTIVFHNPIRPIIWANQVYSHSGPQEAHDYLYYVRGLQEQNPFLVVSVLGCALLLSRLFKFRNKADTTAIAVLINLIVLGGYFTLSAAHKELRYGLAFLPYITLLAGLGIVWITSRIPFRYMNHLVSAILGGTLLYSSHYAFATQWPNYQITSYQAAYQHYFKDKGRVAVITTSPYLVAYSDIKIYSLIASREEGHIELDSSDSHPDYVAFNTCELGCDDPRTCAQAQSQFISLMQKVRQEVFHQTSILPQRSCELYIFK